MPTQPWYQNAVFYEVYVRAFRDSDGDGKGDLRGLIEKLDYLQELGVDCLWLLPIYPSPLKDDGYDIADYYGVHPDFGTLEDFKALLEAAHIRGLRIITDLVLNHTSDQHPWFQSALASRNSSFREYYLWSDTDQKYKDARIIFLDTEKSNWTWDETAGQYYWHRFFSSQPDLNFDNPGVRAEMIQVMKFWLDMGIDGFRVDAVPYLFEREGTNCENLPETHAYLKELREFVDKNYPGRILLCEANQWPKDVRAYFGAEDPQDERLEFNMAFHFPLMPRIFMALRQEDFSPIQWALSETPPIPSGCQWTTFLRNHDELTLEMVTPQERKWMWKEYAPEKRMRLNLGIRRRLAPLLDNDLRKILLAYSLIFSLPGTPVIYYGDEIGMGDNLALPDRNGVRTPMQWDATIGAGFSKNPRPYSPVITKKPYGWKYINVASQRGDPDSLWNSLHRMIALRKKHPAFGQGGYTSIDCGLKAGFAYFRNFDTERILVINNLGSGKMKVDLSIDDVTGKLTNLLTGEPVFLEKGVAHFALKPFEFMWVK